MSREFVARPIHDGAPQSSSRLYELQVVLAGNTKNVPDTRLIEATKQEISN